MNDLAATNTNSLWGWFLAETLVRLGVRQAVVSPGSRSTPIVWALAHCNGIEVLPLLDERGAAFYALGLAKESGRPVVLSCTSGTAAANYLPALVEARESGVALLILTADRPPELRRCASGQAIDQVKMYGSNALDYFELPVPEPTAACLRQLRATLVHALRRTMLPVRGPVHINCPLREPLAPQVGRQLALDFDPEALLGGLAEPKYDWPQPTTDNIALPSSVRHGLIVAGTVEASDDDAAHSALWTLAARSGWPVVCDALGPWRASDVPSGVTRISAYDTFLQNAANRAALAPDCVLQVGPLPTSKVLRQWLASLDLPTLVATTSADDIDPLHCRAESVSIAPEHLDSITLPVNTDRDYAAAWAETDRATREKINAALDRFDGIFEGQVSRELFRTLPAGTRLFIANSMSVRDAEAFCECGHAPLRVHFSRGANGIDSTLATALGCAHGGRGVLLTGDLALLHDAGSLMAARHLRGSLTIVLVDNNGGGIFEKLPVSAIPDPAFEKFFATPQSVDFESLARAYGADYERVESIARLREHIRELPDSGTRILHIRTDRRRDMTFRGEICAGSLNAQPVQRSRGASRSPRSSDRLLPQKWRHRRG
jgi:2-succinyl-5-enolpyruvyl-6-hydroxy-3-cyclohexene-1-carboxylate synthase